MGTELSIRFRRRVSVNEQGRRQQRLPFSGELTYSTAFPTLNYPCCPPLSLMVKADAGPAVEQ
jgi:hypothetical protein